MTPKEKAEELINHFLMITDRNHAKQTASWMVDEIIYSRPMEFDGEDEVSMIGYWEEVKEEIEKL